MVENIVSGLGVAAYLYLVWRNLRQGYDSSGLMGYGWWSILAWWIGGRLGYGLINWGVWNDSWGRWFEFWQYPGVNFLSAYLGWLLLTWWWCVRLSWKLWQFLEDVISEVLVLAGFAVGGEALIGGGWERVVHLVIILAGGGGGWWLRSRYRSFFWYKSGKKGFVFFAVNALIFVTLGLYWVLAGRTLPGNLAVGLGLISLTGLVILGKVRSSR